MLTENWLPVVGNAQWEVSDQGRVRKGDRICKLTPKDSGHLVINMGGIQRRVHHLVLEAFVGPRPEGMEGCHSDDDPTNNVVTNLQWGTRSHNVLDQVRNGLHNNARKTACKYGHDYTPENTYRHPSNGRRECWKCKRARRHVSQPN